MNMIRAAKSCRHCHRSGQALFWGVCLRCKNRQQAKACAGCKALKRELAQAREDLAKARAELAEWEQWFAGQFPRYD